MLRSLPRASIRTMHTNSHAKIAEHEQSFCRRVIFDWFVLSMRRQVILGSSFARPGSAPIWGGKKGELRDWTNWHCGDNLVLRVFHLTAPWTSEGGKMRDPENEGSVGIILM